jgi:hypothetical protein
MRQKDPAERVSKGSCAYECTVWWDRCQDVVWTVESSQAVGTARRAPTESRGIELLLSWEEGVEGGRKVALMCDVGSRT